MCLSVFLKAGAQWQQLRQEAKEILGRKRSAVFKGLVLELDFPDSSFALYFLAIQTWANNLPPYP